MAVIVIGEPRTGTSLAMQTLRHLGYNVYGLKRPPFRRAETNVRGHWEPMERLQDLSWLSDQECIKLDSRKAMTIVDQLLPHKLIVTYRAMADQQRSIEDADIAHSRFGEWTRELLTQLPTTANVLVVTLDSARRDAGAWVRRIAEFVAPLPATGFQAAIANVEAD